MLTLDHSSEATNWKPHGLWSACQDCTSKTPAHTSLQLQPLSPWHCSPLEQRLLPMRTPTLRGKGAGLDPSHALTRAKAAIASVCVHAHTEEQKLGRRTLLLVGKRPPYWHGTNHSHPNPASNQGMHTGGKVKPAQECNLMPSGPCQDSTKVETTIVPRRNPTLSGFLV